MVTDGIFGSHDCIIMIGLSAASSAASSQRSTAAENSHRHNPNEMSCVFLIWLVGGAGSRLSHRNHVLSPSVNMDGLVLRTKQLFSHRLGVEVVWLSVFLVDLRFTSSLWLPYFVRRKKQFQSVSLPNLQVCELQYHFIICLHAHRPVNFKQDNKTRRGYLVATSLGAVQWPSKQAPHNTHTWVHPLLL